MVKLLAFSLCLGLLTFSSCKSSKNITGEVSNDMRINTRLILQQVIDNNYNFQGLEVNRMNCVVELGGKKNSFKGIMRVQDNEFVDFTASKFIPIARALLSPKDVSIISYLQKGYYQGDYDLIAEKFGLLVDYQFVQSLLTGSFSELKDKKLKASSFDCYVEGEYYVLKLKSNRVFGGSNVFAQYLYVNPTTYQIEKLSLVSLSKNDMELAVEYTKHLTIEGRLVPTEMNVEARNGKEVVKVQLQMEKIEFKNNINSSFAISEKYQKLN